MNPLAVVILVLALGAQHLVPAQVPGTWPEWVGRQFGWSVALHGVATAAWLWLCYGVVKGGYRPTFAVALGLAVALRVLVLPLAPAFSDDVNRYVHEGQMVLAGQNPYITKPEDVDASRLQGTYWKSLSEPYGYHRLIDDRRTPTINNPDIPAAYPPAMQLSLAVGVSLVPQPLGMKLVFGGFDLLAFVLLWFWLPSLGLSSARAIVYGFCPLTVLEFAGEGHGDSLAVAFLLLALFASSRGRHGAAGAALAVATAGKFLPALLLPFLLRRSWWVLASFLVVLAALYLPFLADPEEMFKGAAEYTARWRSNDSAFAVVHALVQAIAERGVLGDFEVQRIAKLPIAALGLGLIAWAFRRRWSPEKATAGFFVFFLMFAPTVHPWYAALLLPFLAIWPNPGWLLFYGTVFLAYHALPGWIERREWQEEGWVRVVEYVPFYAGCVWALVAPAAGRPEATK